MPRSRSRKVSAAENNIAVAEKEIARTERVNARRMRRSINNTTRRSTRGIPFPENTGEMYAQHQRATRSQISAAVNGYNVTNNGIEWLKVATNPCDTSAFNQGYPDLESAPVTTPSSRENFDVKLDDKPTASTTGPLPTSAPDDAELWSCMIVSDPSTLSTYILRYQGAINNPSYYNVSTVQDQIRSHIETTGMSASRVTAYGTTVEFTGPTLSDQGELVTAQLKQKWKDVSTTLNEVTRATNTMMAWPLNDQYPYDSPDELLAFASELSTADPQSQVRKAKDGAYFVHKMNNPVLNMCEHDLRTTSEEGNSIMFNNPFYTFFKGIEVPTSLSPTWIQAYSKVPYSWNAGIFHATGLSSAASFLVKKYVHLECQITPKSPLRYYTHRSPLVDENAQHAYNKMVESMPSSFVSAANAFGWLKKAWKWVLGAGKTVFDIVGKLKPVFEVVKPIIGTLGEASAVPLSDSNWITREKRLNYQPRRRLTAT